MKTKLKPTKKTYTEVVAEMTSKLLEEKKREKEMLIDELNEATKGKKIKIEGNLSKSIYLFD